MFQPIKQPLTSEKYDTTPKPIISRQQPIKNSTYQLQEKQIGAFDNKKSSIQGDFYTNRKFVQDKRQDADPQLRMVEKMIDEKTLNEEFTVAQNHEIIQLLIDNAMTYGNVFDGLIKITMAALPKLTGEQRETSEALQFFVCVRLRETIKLADNELTKKINTHLFKIIYSDDCVERINKYFTQMNEMSLSEFESTFGAAQFSSLTPPLLRIALHRQVLMSVMNLAYRYSLRKEVPTASESEFMERLLGLVFETSFYVKFDWRMSYTYIKFISHFASKMPDARHKAIMFQNLSVSCLAVTNMTDYLEDFKQNQLVLLMFMLSRMKINQGSIKTYITFWTKFMAKFERNLELTTPHELKSFFYSLGKVSFITPKIEAFLLVKLQDVCKDVNAWEPDYSINLFACVTSLNWYEQHKDLLDEFVEKYHHHLTHELCIDRKWRIKTPLKFYSALLRTQILDTKYWLYFFELLEELLHSKNTGLKFILQEIVTNRALFQPAVQDEIDSQIIQNASVQRIFKEAEEDYRIEHQDESDNFMMEQTVAKYIQQLGVQVVQHKMINEREVDFFLPEMNIALEVMGPHHFIYRQPNQKEGGQNFNFNLGHTQLHYEIEYNQQTKYKLASLKQHGYRVKTIDFFEPQTISFEEITERILQP